MTHEQRAAGVFDFFLRHGWVAEDHRKQVSNGIELAITAAVGDADSFRRFVLSLLNPSERGHAVPAHVRDDAREVLGRKRVETGKGSGK